MQNRFFVILGATVFLVFAGMRQASALVINEIMYDLPGADDNREWVEIYNDQTNSLSVATGTSGWRFYDGANHVVVSPLQGSAIIPAGGFAVWADDAATFLAEHSGFSGTVFDTVMSLANTTDTLRLLDEYGAIRSEATYQSAWGAAGNGKSLERRPDGTFGESSLDGGTPAVHNSFTASSPSPDPLPTPNPSPTSSQTPTPVPTPMPTDAPTAPPTQTSESTPSATFTLSPEPTPVAVNSTAGPSPGTVAPPPSAAPSPAPVAPLPDIRINEFLPNPQDADAKGEWIELWNAGPTATDISNWKLDDTEGGSPPYTMPSGTTFAAGEYLVFWRMATDIALNNDVDVVRVLTPQGQLYASVSYEKPPQNASSSRTPSGAYVWSGTPTPGSANRIVTREPELSPPSISSPASSPGVSGVFPRSASSTKQTPFFGPEASHKPLIAKTGFAPSVRNAPPSERSDEDNLTTSSILPLLATAADFSASLVGTTPPAYRSFFARHAFWFVLALGSISATAFVRWKRRKQVAETS